MSTDKTDLTKITQSIKEKCEKVSSELNTVHGNATDTIIPKQIESNSTNIDGTSEKFETERCTDFFESEILKTPNKNNFQKNRFKNFPFSIWNRETTEEIIHAPKEAQYLGDFMNELPINCLFNKGTTGCGGTTIAIENDEDYIIAMPYVNVIKNKEAQKKDLLGIYQDVTEEVIKEYLETHEKKKIAVTYDKLEYLIMLLQSYGYNPYKDFDLLVDEWHILFNSYSFRNDAIKKVLFHSPKFEHVTFMTATPIEKEYVLDELSHYPIREVVWSKKNTFKIQLENVSKPINRVVELIQAALNGKLLGNLHFFVNSVELIADAIFKANLRPEQVRVICSLNSNAGKGKRSNQFKLGNDFKIASTTDEVKRINFYTSTCFEGCDIYDENGRTYIVSDIYKTQTLLDISTLVIQICGRIRNSKYKHQITHIYTKTGESEISLEEYKNNTQKDIVKVENWIGEVNKMNYEAREITIQLLNRSNKTGLNSKFIEIKGNKLFLDSNMVKLDIINFNIRNHIYSSKDSLKSEFAKYGIEVVSHNDIFYSDKLAANTKAKIPFKDLFIEYCQLKEFKYCFGNDLERIHIIEQEKAIVRDAYEKLGEIKVMELDYKLGKIKTAIFNLSGNISEDGKIVHCLKTKGANSGADKTKKEWKSIIQETYNDLEIRTGTGKIRTAKAKDLEKWFELKETTPQINGKTTDCYTIIRERIIYK